MDEVIFTKDGEYAITMQYDSSGSALVTCEGSEPLTLPYLYAQQLEEAFIGDGWNAFRMTVKSLRMVEND